MRTDSSFAGANHKKGVEKVDVRSSSKDGANIVPNTEKITSADSHLSHANDPNTKPKKLRIFQTIETRCRASNSKSVRVS